MRRIAAFIAAVTAATAALTLPSPPPAAAQIVDIQPIIADAKKPGFSGEVTAAASWQTGNTDYFLGDLSVLLRYRFGHNLLLWSSSGELGLKSGHPFTESVFSHLRYQYEINDWLTWEAYGQVATNRFQRLVLRGLVGTGPRFELVRTAAIEVAVGLSYMFEYEILSHDSTLPDSGRHDINHRLSSYLTARWRLAKTLSLVETAYCQPRFDLWADFRVLSVTNLVVNVNKTLAVTIGFSVAYDSRPPASIGRLDTSLAAKLSVAF